ncbi:uncharacterized protein PGTG_17283 [Puccinia graminis f. sp. tritici CRL 75-36-700-3]|uniref:Uncharacterized protein n=1 Tax=Puccinia graminis f. sp. tritici (strain CRL 75-36-700-3 / race SCCL) TaxID=418459 RepID=E3L386_PUCGT|nr:uncharacterized protein PGTG_17283 [Puccinia graminis f. sp. tritici CRL 75-36-700-3]EFP91011.2 hypothetical protein PGTG_17283 [Puccinia graminis f. sp. tritici CRL 75-36-700-3]
MLYCLLTFRLDQLRKDSHWASKESLLAGLGHANGSTSKAEGLLVRTTTAYQNPPQNQQWKVGHMLMISILVAAESKPVAELGPALWDHITSSQKSYNFHLEQIQLMMKAVHCMRARLFKYTSADTSSLANFLIGGFRGLLLGPKKVICTPVAAAIQMQLLAWAEPNKTLMASGLIHLGTYWISC